MKKILPSALAAKPLLLPGRGRGGVLSSATTLLTLSGLLASAPAAHAQFPINESFAEATTPNFTLGGTATLTGTAAAPGTGYLRLTSANNNEAGYAVLNGTFPSSKGFSVSFEFFAYGGTGADGLSVFLVDADGTDPAKGEFAIGAYGGSLGYANIVTFVTQAGVSKGYLGIGLDEFGNYSQGNEGRQGGPGFTKQAVALRGPAAGGYQYLTGTNTLPFTLDVATPRAQPGSADYRKAYLYVLPTSGGGYTITIRLQHGRTVTTTTNAYTVTAPPANLRVGFAGSTGNQTNIHEIRGLAILDNPFAVDDTTQTVYNKPVTRNVVANDRGIGAELRVSTVDLNPDKEGIQTKLVVAEGTFEVDELGVVTFTPNGTFAGVVTVPYVVSDIVEKVSNPALLTVNVLGADVASAISGPVSGSVGASLTYTISTRNNGSEMARNVSPTLQLPLGLPLPPSAGYAYDALTGMVKFAPIATLAVNEEVTSSLTFPAPPLIVNIGLLLTSGYAYPADARIPDPVASNNTATLAVAPASPLPVELTRFEVTATRQTALVSWHTASEQRNDHFTVERSLTSADFRAIGTVRSQGNGLRPHDYRFPDPEAGRLNAETVYYRLQQVDVDGTTTYGPVRSVRFAPAPALATLYPNPSQGPAQLDLSRLPAGPYLVQVLDLTGRVLRTQPATAALAPLDLAGLPQGAYLVVVQGAGLRQTLPLLRN